MDLSTALALTLTLVTIIVGLLLFRDRIAIAIKAVTGRVRGLGGSDLTDSFETAGAVLERAVGGGTALVRDETGKGIRLTDVRVGVKRPFEKLDRTRSWSSARSMVILISIAFVSFNLVIFLGYIFQWNWVGVVQFSYEKGVPKEISGIKTLWDWLALLIIPIILLIGTWWLGRAEKQREQESLHKRLESDRAIAHQSEQRMLLEAYFDVMTDLLMKQDLRGSRSGDEVRNIARIRTLSAVRNLDGFHKAQVILFLYESGLISTDDVFVDLRDADLSGMRLLGKDLTAISLAGANLAGTSFQKSRLTGANLAGAKLTGIYQGTLGLLSADFEEANLQNANLSNVELGGFEFTDMEIRGDLRGHGANFEKADLRGANFEGADFATYCRLLGQSFVEGTIRIDPPVFNKAKF